MATLEKIRNKSGLLLAVIGFAMLAFISTDFMSSLGSGGGGSIYVGEVLGEDVMRQAYEVKVEEGIENWKSQNQEGVLNQTTTAQIRSQIWDQYVRDLIMNNEFGGTSGMLTIEDVTEEIVGEIVDEHDVEEITDKKLSKNKYQLFARLDIEMVNKKYDLRLPESDEYETIAGLILHHLEEIPQKNDLIKLEEFQFTIIKVNETAIQEVQLKVSTR